MNDLCKALARLVDRTSVFEVCMFTIVFWFLAMCLLSVIKQ